MSEHKSAVNRVLEFWFIVSLYGFTIYIPVSRIFPNVTKAAIPAYLLLLLYFISLIGIYTTKLLFSKNRFLNFSPLAFDLCLYGYIISTLTILSASSARYAYVAMIFFYLSCFFMIMTIYREKLFNELSDGMKTDLSDEISGLTPAETELKFIISMMRVS